MDTSDAGRHPAVRSVTGPLWARSFLLVIPAVWLGLVLGISLIEAPLKFTAPGITIPLGLGIGRRVFMAMNIVEVVLAVLLLVAMWRTVGRPGRQPFLNIRTDAVLAGDLAAGSTTHYFYIAAEVGLLVALVALLITAARSVL
jgi:hypothetical protein